MQHGSVASLHRKVPCGLIDCEDTTSQRVVLVAHRYCSAVPMGYCSAAQWYRTCPPGFLVVPLHRFGKREVYDPPHVGLVHSHAKRDGGNHNLRRGRPPRERAEVQRD
jgi:hypothetical protein